MAVSKILAEENIQALIKWKWGADCVIMYKGGTWKVEHWLSPKIPQPSTDEIKAEISNYQVELDKTFYKLQRVGLADGYPKISEQLDQLYHDINDGKFGANAKKGQWFVGISSVKTTYPKP
tara:strand:- start:67 stop:429 length:363 start_codon:yes stop_codon:yes gene_type:complete